VLAADALSCIEDSDLDGIHLLWAADCRGGHSLGGYNIWRRRSKVHLEITVNVFHPDLGVPQPRHSYAVFAELRRRYLYLHVRSATVYTLLEPSRQSGGSRPGRAVTAQRIRTGELAWP
jgi:hypothetical protein